MPRPPKYIVAAASHLAHTPPNLYLGTSGWAYPTWKPDFYPKPVPARGFLAHYASVLTAVEVNYTFRTLPSAAQLAGWLSLTPPGFQFSFKAPQQITHFRRLQECEAAISRFFEAIGPAQQENRLGPVLFQLPPNFKADTARLRSFLANPIFHTAAAPRLAFEFRHASWFEDEVYRILEKANAALCIAETDDLDTPQVQTADFNCYRLRRDGGYTGAELDAFAEAFLERAAQLPTFVFFRHQEKPTGALNAVGLLERVNARTRRDQEPSLEKKRS